MYLDFLEKNLPEGTRVTTTIDNLYETVGERLLGGEGMYALGSGNTVANYVPQKIT